MATLTLTDIVFNSGLESATVNSIFAEIESFLNGVTASADITITGDMTADSFITKKDGSGIGSGAYIIGANSDSGLYWDGFNIVFETLSVLTNSPQYINLIHTTSGTPAAGIGYGIKAIVETSAGNNEIGGILEIISTDVTPTIEDFDLVIKLMKGGDSATEIARFVSDGSLKIGNDALSANYLWSTNGGLISNNTEFKITTNSSASIPIVFYIGGTFGTITAGTEVARLTPSGYFGLGTDLPLVNMHIYKSDDTDDTMFLIENAGLGDAAFQFKLSASDFVIGLDNSDSDKLKMGYSTSVSSVTSFVMNSSGNIGIGTADPSYILEIEDSSPFVLIVSSDDTDAGLGISSGATSDAFISFSDSIGPKWVFGVDASDSDKFVLSEGANLGTNNCIEFLSGGAIEVLDNFTIGSGFLNFGTAAPLTIATGAVTATQTTHTIDTEGATASDDLDTINGGTEGDILIITSANNARTVVVKDATGNINCAGDFSMTDTRDYMCLISRDGNWYETSRSDNA